MEQLGQRWRAAPVDDALRRVFAEPGHDDSAWEPVPVPGHWRSVPAFADLDGPVAYRAGFDHRPPRPGERWWLDFDGILGEGDVWLDGAYLGNTTGYFAPHTFEVTEPLGDRRSHVLAVEVACGGVGSAAGPAAPGALGSPEVLPAGSNPGGIWRPIRLRSSGPVHLRHLVVRCTEATEERAVLRFGAHLDASRAVAAHLHTTVGGADHGTDRPLAAGANTVEWTVSVPRPRRWWPHALGEAALEWVEVEVRLPSEGADGDDSTGVSDRRRFRTGLRTVDWDRGVISVNGERLFCKGTTLLPLTPFPGTASAEACRSEVFRARRLGLDLVRLRGHVARPETYEAADAHGVLLWQDVPPGTAAARTRGRATAQALVGALGHHPSVAVWSTGPAAGTPGAGLGATLAAPTGRPLGDRAVRRALQRADGSRPVVDGYDAGSWSRWDGDARELADSVRRWPARARFVHAIGAPAGRGDRTSQAETVRLQVETLRRLKYRPTGGFCQYALADTPAGEDFGLVDADGVDRPALEAMARACRPITVIADPLPRRVRPTDALALDVHVVSDRRHEAGGQVTATLTWDGGGHRWQFAGTVPADGCALVGTIRFEVPAARGPLRLELTGEVGGESVDNCYEAAIDTVPAP